MRESNWRVVRAREPEIVFLDFLRSLLFATRRGHEGRHSSLSPSNHRFPLPIKKSVIKIRMAPPVTDSSYVHDEKRTKIATAEGNKDDPFFAADAAAAVQPPPAPSVEGEAGPDAGPDGTKKLSKSAMKKAAKKKALGEKKDKSALKASWGQPKDGKSKKDKAKEEKAAKAVKFTFEDPTPKGEKKLIKDIEMPEAYHPSYVESSWQQWWEDR